MKKFLTLTLVLALMVTTLPATAFAGDSKNIIRTLRQRQSPPPVEISISWWGNDFRHMVMNEALDLFMERYPHITVIPEYGAIGWYLDYLITQLAYGQGTDVMLVNYSWLHTFGNGYNIFANLRDFDHILDLNQWSAEHLEFTTTADDEALMILGDALGIPSTERALYIIERDGHIWGLLLESITLLDENPGRMCPMFENLELRQWRFAAIEDLRLGLIDARTAAERWVNDQQAELEGIV